MVGATPGALFDLAVSHGATPLGRAHLGDGIVVEGERARLVAAALMMGVLPLAAVGGGCGAAAKGIAR